MKEAPLICIPLHYYFSSLSGHSSLPLLFVSCLESCPHSHHSTEVTFTKTNDLSFVQTNGLFWSYFYSVLWHLTLCSSHPVTFSSPGFHHTLTWWFSLRLTPVLVSSAGILSSSSFNCQWSLKFRPCFSSNYCLYVPRQFHLLPLFNCHISYDPKSLSQIPKYFQDPRSLIPRLMPISTMTTWQTATQSSSEITTSLKLS